MSHSSCVDPFKYDPVVIVKKLTHAEIDMYKPSTSKMSDKCDLSKKNALKKKRIKKCTGKFKQLKQLDVQQLLLKEENRQVIHYCEGSDVENNCCKILIESFNYPDKNHNELIENIPNILSTPENYNSFKMSKNKKQSTSTENTLKRKASPQRTVNQKAQNQVEGPQVRKALEGNSTGRNIQSDSSAKRIFLFEMPTKNTCGTTIEWTNVPSTPKKSTSKIPAETSAKSSIQKINAEKPSVPVQIPLDRLKGILSKNTFSNNIKSSTSNINPSISFREEKENPLHVQKRTTNSIESSISICSDSSSTEEFDSDATEILDSHYFPASNKKVAESDQPLVKANAEKSTIEDTNRLKRRGSLSTLNIEVFEHTTTPGMEKILHQGKNDDKSKAIEKIYKQTPKKLDREKQVITNAKESNEKQYSSSSSCSSKDNDKISTKKTQKKDDDYNHSKRRKLTKSAVSKDTSKGYKSSKRDRRISSESSSSEDDKVENKKNEKITKSSTSKSECVVNKKLECNEKLHSKSISSSGSSQSSNKTESNSKKIENEKNPPSSSGYKRSNSSSSSNHEHSSKPRHHSDRKYSSSHTHSAKETRHGNYSKEMKFGESDSSFLLQPIYSFLLLPCQVKQTINPQSTSQSNIIQCTSYTPTNAGKNENESSFNSIENVIENVSENSKITISSVNQLVEKDLIQSVETEISTSGNHKEDDNRDKLENQFVCNTDDNMINKINDMEKENVSSAVSSSSISNSSNTSNSISVNNIASDATIDSPQDVVQTTIEIESIPNSNSENALNTCAETSTNTETNVINKNPRDTINFVDLTVVKEEQFTAEEPRLRLVNNITLGLISTEEVEMISKIRYSLLLAVIERIQHRHKVSVFQTSNEEKQLVDKLIEQLNENFKLSMLTKLKDIAAATDGNFGFLKKDAVISHIFSEIKPLSSQFPENVMKKHVTSLIELLFQYWDEEKRKSDNSIRKDTNVGETHTQSKSSTSNIIDIVSNSNTNKSFPPNLDISHVNKNKKNDNKAPPRKYAKRPEQPSLNRVLENKNMAVIRSMPSLDNIQTGCNSNIPIDQQTNNFVGMMPRNTFNSQSNVQPRTNIQNTTHPFKNVNHGSTNSYLNKGSSNPSYQNYNSTYNHQEAGVQNLQDNNFNSPQNHHDHVFNQNQGAGYPYQNNAISNRNPHVNRTQSPLSSQSSQQIPINYNNYTRSNDFPNQNTKTPWQVSGNMRQPNYCVPPYPPPGYSPNRNIPQMGAPYLANLSGENSYQNWRNNQNMMSIQGIQRAPNITQPQVSLPQTIANSSQNQSKGTNSLSQMQTTDPSQNRFLTKSTTPLRSINSYPLGTNRLNEGIAPFQNNQAINGYNLQNGSNVQQPMPPRSVESSSTLYSPIMEGSLNSSSNSNSQLERYFGRENTLPTPTSPYLQALLNNINQKVLSQKPSNSTVVAQKPTNISVISSAQEKNDSVSFVVTQSNVNLTPTSSHQVVTDNGSQISREVNQGKKILPASQATNSSETSGNTSNCPAPMPYQCTSIKIPNKANSTTVDTHIGNSAQIGSNSQNSGKKSFFRVVVSPMNGPPSHTIESTGDIIIPEIFTKLLAEVEAQNKKSNLKESIIQNNLPIQSENLQNLSHVPQLYTPQKNANSNNFPSLKIISDVTFSKALQKHRNETQNTLSSHPIIHIEENQSEKTINSVVSDSSNFPSRMEVSSTEANIVSKSKTTFAKILNSELSNTLHIIETQNVQSNKCVKSQQNAVNVIVSNSSSTTSTCPSTAQSYENTSASTATVQNKQSLESNSTITSNGCDITIKTILNHSQNLQTNENKNESLSKNFGTNNTTRVSGTYYPKKYCSKNTQQFNFNINGDRNKRSTNSVTCSICVRTFKHSMSLFNHIKLVHS